MVVERALDPREGKYRCYMRRLRNDDPRKLGRQLKYYNRRHAAWYAGLPFGQWAEIV
jgi:hypothetical protein